MAVSMILTAGGASDNKKAVSIGEIPTAGVQSWLNGQRVGALLPGKGERISTVRCAIRICLTNVKCGQYIRGARDCQGFE